MLISVAYGIYDDLAVARKGRAYTYQCPYDVDPGDIIEVPPTWLSRESLNATVVDVEVPLPSDPDIELSSVERVVRKTGEDRLKQTES